MALKHPHPWLGFRLLPELRIVGEGKPDRGWRFFLSFEATFQKVEMTIRNLRLHPCIDVETKVEGYVLVGHDHEKICEESFLLGSLPPRSCLKRYFVLANPNPKWEIPSGIDIWIWYRRPNSQLCYTDVHTSGTFGVCQDGSRFGTIQSAKALFCGETFDTRGRCENEIQYIRAPVLLLGPDKGDSMVTLKSLQSQLQRLGVQGLLLREEPDRSFETLEQKLLRLASGSLLAIIADFEPSGHIDELSLLARTRIPIAVLRPIGVGGTWMQADYDESFTFVKTFLLQADGWENILEEALDWAEDFLRKRSECLSRLYPWRVEE